jgi:thioredoxin-related protein
MKIPSGLRIALIPALMLWAMTAADARAPDGWSFVEFNQAAREAKRTGKPLFVYFGFATCPYCEYANRNTFSYEALRRRYTDHYVLAYFDIRGNPDDMIELPNGEKLTRAAAIKRFKGSPVPAWMFMAPDGREILVRRGSRTKVDAFMKFDQYVAGGAYRQTSFEDFLAAHGLREDKVE